MQQIDLRSFSPQISSTKSDNFCNFSYTVCNPGEPKNLKFSATKEVMESPRPTYDDEVVGNIVRRSMSEDGGDLFACDTTFLEYMVKKFKSDQSARQSEIDKKRASNR